MDSQNNPVTWIISTAATTAIFTTLMGFVPTVAAIVALVWYIIQIYECDTVKRWRAARRVRKLARLKARVLLLESKPVPLPPDVVEKL